MCALKARQPEAVKANKPKFMISGESGVGKTFFALEFPKPYLIDTEVGATRPQYQDKLKKSGGAYFGKEEGSQDFDEIIKEVKLLCTEKHPYKTLIIDSISYVYLLEAAIAEESVGSDYARDKKEANKPVRQLMRMLDKLDMNVILIAHSKTKWARKDNTLYSDGTTFDCYDKLEYILDLWCEIQKGGKTFMVKKSRVQGLPQNSSFPLTYDKFAELYGKETIESEVKPIEFATPDKIDKVNSLIEALNVKPELISKWFKKCDVESWDEMTVKQIDDHIDLMNKKIMEISMKQDKKGK